MKTFMIIVILILSSFSIIFLSLLIIDKYVKRDTKFGKWWNKNIVHELDPNDPNF